jgi:hypothetical protein
MIMSGLSLLDHEDGLDDGVHLVHVGAGPHDPHADCPDYARHYCHPILAQWYCRLADTACGGLFMPT